METYLVFRGACCGDIPCVYGCLLWRHTLCLGVFVVETYLVFRGVCCGDIPCV